MKCAKCGASLNKYDSTCPVCFTRVSSCCKICNKPLPAGATSMCPECAKIYPDKDYGEVKQLAQSSLGVGLGRAAVTLLLLGIGYVVSPLDFPGLIDDAIVGGGLTLFSMVLFGLKSFSRKKPR